MPNKYLVKLAEQKINESSALKRSLKTTASSLGSATLVGGAGALAGAALAAKSPGMRKGITAVAGGAKKLYNKLPSAVRESKVAKYTAEQTKKHGAAIGAGAVIGHQVGEGIGDFAAIHHGTRKAMQEGNKK